MDSEFQKEQKRVGCVIETITEGIKKLEEENSQRRNELVTIRKHFWGDVKVNVDSFDDYLETIIGLRQEAQVLSVSQSTVRQVKKNYPSFDECKSLPTLDESILLKKGISLRNKYILESLH